MQDVKNKVISAGFNHDIDMRATGCLRHRREKEPADTPAETPSTEEPAGEEKQAAEEPEPDIDISEFVEISKLRVRGSTSKRYGRQNA